MINYKKKEKKIYIITKINEIKSKVTKKWKTGPKGLYNKYIPISLSIKKLQWKVIMEKALKIRYAILKKVLKS